MLSDLNVHCEQQFSRDIGSRSFLLAVLLPLLYLEKFGGQILCSCLVFGSSASCETDQGLLKALN